MKKTIALATFICLVSLISTAGAWTSWNYYWATTTTQTNSNTANNENNQNQITQINIIDVERQKGQIIGVVIDIKKFGLEHVENGDAPSVVDKDGDRRIQAGEHVYSANDVCLAKISVENIVNNLENRVNSGPPRWIAGGSYRVRHYYDTANVRYSFIPVWRLRADGTPDCAEGFIIKGIAKNNTSTNTSTAYSNTNTYGQYSYNQTPNYSNKSTYNNWNTINTTNTWNTNNWNWNTHNSTTHTYNNWNASNTTNTWNTNNWNWNSWIYS